MVIYRGLVHSVHTVLGLIVLQEAQGGTNFASTKHKNNVKESYMGRTFLLILIVAKQANFQFVNIFYKFDTLP